MKQSAEAFFEQIQDKSVWFVGIGVTHTETIQLFARRGIAVTACDKRTRSQLGEVCGVLEALKVRLLVGEDYPGDFAGADVLFRTPGMYFHSPELEAFRESGGVLTSEMEVFFDLCPCPVIAVTGSDGKTTTTTLIAEMLREQGRKVHLGGNIGRALLPSIFDISGEDMAVVELSSFQLISMRCSPQVAVVTNVTPNHLDVHGTMEEYVDAKRNIFAHQNAFSRTVLGLDNELSRSFGSEVRGHRVFFSLESPVENGAYMDTQGDLYMATCHEAPELVMNRSLIRLPGIHNVANYLAAISAVWGLVEPDNIRRVAETFGGVEHRIEFVRELDGVKWYNDSIATSPTRAIAGLRAFDQKIIMIAGGYDKKIPFQPMACDVVERVSNLILTGHTADKIEETIKSCPGYTKNTPRILRADSMGAAVAVAKKMAKPGDIISLSPACASFDAYPNFEARGRHYKELVNALLPKETKEVK